MPNESSVGVRLQRSPTADQAIVLARLVEGRATGTGGFSPSELTDVFEQCSLPPPARVSNVLATLQRRRMVMRSSRGRWRLTPLGRAESERLASDMDVAKLAAESALARGATLGHATHPLIPPNLAPPEILGPVAAFLSDHPFDTNVFAMTRFPSEPEASADPIGPAIEAARRACLEHGLELHLASDRALVPDLWSNVVAHAWASRYGIAFIEDQVGRGLNHNLTIEVGVMLALGRRTALMKDDTLDELPTDLIGKIYKPVALSDEATVEAAVHEWARDDLGLGVCAECR